MREPRTEFGAARTECACKGCVTNCKFIPGYLIPADLDRLIPPDADPVSWACEHLRASPGAAVAKMTPEGPQYFRIPTLVPRHRDDLSCHWLDPETLRCRVHADAPLGCAFFDCKQSQDEADALSSKGLVEIAKAFAEGERYAFLWTTLDAMGLVSPAPNVKREAMHRAMSQQHEQR